MLAHLSALINTCSANVDPLPGNGRIPTDEMEMAAHLYIGIQAFFARHADLRRRPFFITGESYAGKYVPSIGMCKLCVIHVMGVIMVMHRPSLLV